MTDIALKWQLDTADLDVAANDYVTDDSLETSVLISIFTDARAARSDALPDTQTSRRGWFGDLFNDDPQDRIGSKLWLLSREKQTEETRLHAQDYARQALQWLIDDQISDSVTVDAEWVDRGVVQLAITIERPRTDPVQYRFNYTWDSQEARLSFEAVGPELTLSRAGFQPLELYPGFFLTVDDFGAPLTVS